MPIDGISLAPRSRDAGRADTKAAQYFEMLGDRGDLARRLEGGGLPPPRAPTSRTTAGSCTTWTRTSPSATTSPTRSPSGCASWSSGGGPRPGRYGVLPLDDRILERFLVPKPRPITGRSTFTYYAGAPIPSDGDARTSRTSRTRSPPTSTVGATASIVSCGDRFSGYALFVHDGHLVHDYNAPGDPPRRPLDGRRAARTVRASPTASHGPVPLQGTGELSIDGRPCGSVAIDRTLGVHDSPAGLTVGRTRLSAIAADYEAPFPFDGTIDRVELTLGADRGAPAPLPLGAMD